MTGAGLYGCPICGQGLTPAELESHYSTELDFLAKISLSVLRSPETREMVRHRFAVNNLSPGSHGGLAEQAPRNRWDVSQVILFYFLNFFCSILVSPLPSCCRKDKKSDVLLLLVANNFPSDHLQ